jgi:hypothetical protein
LLPQAGGRKRDERNRHELKQVQEKEGIVGAVDVFEHAVMIDPDGADHEEAKCKR